MTNHSARLKPFIVEDLNSGREYPVLADCPYCAIDTICFAWDLEVDDRLVVMNTNRSIVMAA
jgi:hypothetical protein